MNTVKDNLRRYYNAEAAVRDGKTVKADWKVRVRERFCRLLQQENKKSLLELGAGAGYDSRFFQDSGLRVVAVDLSGEMVKRCRDKGIEAFELDFCDLSPLNRKFDSVYAINTLLHVPNADFGRLLCEISSALNENGLFYLGTYGGDDTETESVIPEISDAPRYFIFRSADTLKRSALQYFDLVDFETLEVGDGDVFHSMTLRKKPARA